MSCHVVADGEKANFEDSPSKRSDAVIKRKFEPISIVLRVFIEKSGKTASRSEFRSIKASAKEPSSHTRIKIMLVSERCKMKILRKEHFVKKSIFMIFPLFA